MAAVPCLSNLACKLLSMSIATFLLFGSALIVLLFLTCLVLLIVLHKFHFLFRLTVCSPGAWLEVGKKSSNRSDRRGPTQVLGAEFDFGAPGATVCGGIFR